MALIGVSGRLELGVTRFVVLICCWEAGHPFGGVPLFLCPGRESNPSTSPDRWRNHSQPDAGRRGPGVGDEAALGVRLPTPAKNPILGALAHDWTLTRKRLMIPHPDDMRAIAESIEQDFEDRMGWDATPMLGMVLRQPQDVVDRNSRPEFKSGQFVVYGVFPFPVQPTEIDDNPGQGLLTLGTMLRHSPNAPEVIIPRTVVQDFAGLLFVGEGYGMAYEQRADREKETRRFADIPGAKEVRFGVLLDCGGRVHFADRIRGEKPTVRTAEPDDPRVRSSGNVIIGLRDIMVAIGRQVPFGSMDLDAVASVAREDEP